MSDDKRVSVFLKIFAQLSDSTLALDETFVADFELTAIEARAIKAAIEEARAKSDAIEVKMASGGWRENSKDWIVSVPPFPEQGGAIFDHLNQQLAQILGNERMALFSKTYAESLDLYLGQLGAGERIIVVSGEPDLTKPPHVLVQVRDQVVRDGRILSTSQRKVPLSRLSQRLGRFSAHISPEFAARLKDGLAHSTDKE